MSRYKKSRHPQKQPPKTPQKAKQPSPDEKKVEAIVQRKVFQMRGEIFTGPLPHPDILVKYNQAVPDAAERILKMAEKQSHHRSELEKSVIASDIEARKRGQIFAFILAFIILVGGFGLIALNKDISGMVSLVAGGGSLIGVFIYGAKQRKQERIDKYGLIPRKANQSSQ